MAVIVHHPRPEFTGTARIGRTSLRFTDGVAQADGVNVAAFRRAGYRLSHGGVRLEGLTVARLSDRGVGELTFADPVEEPTVVDERTFADPVESDEDPDVVDE